jgi:hypothetical protein
MAWAQYFEPYRVAIYHMLIGFMLDLLIVGVLKALVQRKRPSYNKPDMHIVVSVDKFSFPSGEKALFSNTRGRGSLQQLLVLASASRLVREAEGAQRWLSGRE